jgi:hypothetical protein
VDGAGAQDQSIAPLSVNSEEYMQCGVVHAES